MNAVMGRPRLPDPDGKREARRIRKQLGNATRLMRGVQITNYGDHHHGMKLVKSYVGDPRPDTCPTCGRYGLVTLSLVNPDSPSAYWGQSTQGKPYLFSTDPDDYVWECMKCNVARGKPTRQSQQVRIV